MPLFPAKAWPLAALAAWLALGGWALAEDGPAAANRAGPSVEQIAKWVRELDADEFLVRETAMLQLLEAGPAGLPALRSVLAGGSLEATSRALFVVRQIGLSAGVAEHDAAGELLAELANHKETPVLAARAAATLAELTIERSIQALAELEKLGAKVNRGQVVMGFLVAETLASIELGEAFHGSEHDLARLKWLTEVPVLTLSGQRVNDSWIKPALAMPGLEELHLYRTTVSSKGLAALADHPTLRQVGLYYTPIDDTALSKLAKVNLLTYVKLYGTQVTPKGLEEFQRTSEGVNVDYKRGAFMGVRCSDLNGACQVSSIHPGSPAEKAGLRGGDLVVRFGGAKVTNFESLMRLIATRDVDEEVPVEVARASADDGNPFQPISTTVKLAPWDIDAAVQNQRR